MRKPTIKRFIAYFIDIIIVGLIAASLSSTRVLNPYYEKYQAAQDKLQTVMEESTKDGKQINEVLNNNELVDLSYEVTKTGVFVNIYTVVLSFLYFVCFQYITKGKTLGKKLLKIEIVSNDKKELRFIQLLKRSIIINSLVTSTIGIALIMLLSKSAYIDYSKYVQLVETTLILLSAGFVLYREDGRGLHDIFGGTRVILSQDKEFYLKHDSIKEAEIIEEEIKEEIVEEKPNKVVKKKITKKTTTKKKDN